MKRNDLSRRAAYAAVATVLGFGVAIGGAFSCRADFSPADQGAAVSEVSGLNEGPGETYQAGKTDPAPVGKRIDRRALLVGVTKYDNLDQQPAPGPGQRRATRQMLIAGTLQVSTRRHRILDRGRRNPSPTADTLQHRAGVPEAGRAGRGRRSGRGFAVGAWGPPAGIRSPGHGLPRARWNR